MSEHPIYIIGHKNPDADAVCAAIAYADLKKRLGLERYVPARCGNSNIRIDTILERFQVPLPVFVGDVTPTVSDIMQQDVQLIEEGATCADALDLIEKHDVRSLPVVDKDKKLLGLISIFNLGEFFIPHPEKNKEIRHVHGTIEQILRSLKGTAVNLVDPSRLEHLYVYVGAMDIRSFGRFVEKEGTKTEESVVIVGDRWDIQQKAIQMGVRLIIITGGEQVDPQVLEMAKERGVSILISPYDSATTAWVTRTATLLKPMMAEDLVEFTPDEPLHQVRRKISKAHAMAYMVVDENRRLCGLFTNSDIIKPVQRSVVLVDHNELSQAVKGVDQVNIIEVIDHHRLGNPPTSQPILFRNETVGSTCTIIAEMFRANKINPDPSMAGIMMAGIVSDTLNLQSPTSTPRDATILEWLNQFAGIDIDELSELIFTAGSLIINSTPAKVISTDCKVYTEGDVRYSVSQIEELGFDNFWKAYKDIQSALDSYREENRLKFSCLLVTDVRKQDSLFLLSGPRELKETISYTTVKEDYIFDMPSIVSRKKQLIPHLGKILSSVGWS